ncbi:MAG: ABC transporter permease [Elusimicrobiaceae bacterium]|nr:ABC transporter permease [Elusimicrobiaceae bacterium]
MTEKKIFKQIVKNKNSLIGLIIVALFFLIAVFAPILAPVQNKNNPYQMPQASFQVNPTAPSAQNLLGTTENQYDIYYGIVWGTRMAFKVGLSVVFVALLIGIIIGGAAGFFGSWIDEILMRLTDIVFAVPSMVLAMVIAAMLGPDLKNMMIAITIVSWPSYARLIRGDVMSVKEREFISATKALGASKRRIFLRHILPNAIYPVVIVASLDIGYIVLTAASLSFLGLGSQTGTADWGQLVALSRNWILGTHGNAFEYWYTLVIPGGALLLFVLAWNMLGDAFRDILDPRTH